MACASRGSGAIHMSWQHTSASTCHTFAGAPQLYNRPHFSLLACGAIANRELALCVRGVEHRVRNGFVMMPGVGVL